MSVALLDSKLAGLTHREGDARGELYAYLKGTQTVGAVRAYRIGEMLRACGIGWSTGIGALWAAGLLGDYARAIMSLAQTADGWTHQWTPRDVAAMLGTHAPISASRSFALSLTADDERLDEGLQFDRAYAERLASDRNNFAEWIEKDSHGLSRFIDTLPAHWSGEADWRTAAVSRKNRSALPFDDLLVSAAMLGDNKEIPIDAREFSVWSQIFMWAIKAASPSLREGRIANLAAVWAALPSRLIEREREAAIARARARAQKASAEPKRNQE